MMMFSSTTKLYLYFSLVCAKICAHIFSVNIVVARTEEKRREVEKKGHRCNEMAKPQQLTI